MSYILDSESASGSPFAVVTISASTILHPDTVVDAPWVVYNAVTETLAVDSTSAYFECSMSYDRAVAKGLVTISLDPNGTSDTHTWGQIFVAGGVVGAGSYGRGDDTAYSVDTSTKVVNRYIVGTYSSNISRSKTIVRRL